MPNNANFNLFLVQPTSIYWMSTVFPILNWMQKSLRQNSCKVFPFKSVGQTKQTITIVYDSAKRRVCNNNSGQHFNGSVEPSDTLGTFLVFTCYSSETQMHCFSLNSWMQPTETDWLL